MKYGLKITVPDDDRGFILSGLEVAVMWTWGFAEEFKTMQAAIAFGAKNYGPSWKPQPVPLQLAQQLVNDVAEVYSGKKKVVRVRGRPKVISGNDTAPGIARIQEIMRRGDGVGKSHDFVHRKD